MVKVIDRIKMKMSSKNYTRINDILLININT